MNHRDAIAAQIASRYSLPSTNLQANIQHFLNAGIPMSNIMRHPAYAEMSALDQGGGGFGGGGFIGGGDAAPEPYQWPADPADPADYSGDIDAGPTGALGGPIGLGAAVNGGIVGSMSAQNATTGGTNAIGYSPGTGLGLTTQGYGSNLGHAHAAAMADSAMTTMGIYDAIDTSQDVNAAVDEAGYNTPSTPDPATPGLPNPDNGLSTIVGLPSDFTTSNASLDTGPAGGFDAGSAIAADVAGLSGLNAGVNDAAAGYGGFSGDSGVGGGGGAGGGGGK